MIRRPPQIGRNDKCPCKSGKKFKQCCLLKQRQPTPSPEQLVAAQQSQLAMQAAQQNAHANMFVQERIKEFQHRFGRRPGPGDRIFFETPSQEEVLSKVAQAMEAAKIDPAHVYAFKKTGLIVVSENMDFLTGQDLEIWTAAVDEYRSEHATGATHE